MFGAIMEMVAFYNDRPFIATVKKILLNSIDNFKMQLHYCIIKHILVEANF